MLAIVFSYCSSILLIVSSSDDLRLLIMVKRFPVSGIFHGGTQSAAYHSSRNIYTANRPKPAYHDGFFIYWPNRRRLSNMGM